MTMTEDIETLKRKLAQKEKELEIILAIDRIRDGTTDMQQLLSSTVEIVTSYLDADLCLMSLMEEESGELELKMVDDRQGIFGQLSQETLRKAAEQSTAIGHVSVLDDTFGLHQQGVNHLLAAPLLIGGEQLGSLLLLNKEQGFDQDDIDLLEAVVSQTDSAVVHARTYGQLQQRNKELETIYRIDRIRDSGLEFQPMLNTVLNELCQAITAEVGFIMLFDETGQQLELKASTESDIFAIADHYRLVQEMANKALWKARLINRRDLDPRIRSIICIPLILREKIIGIFGAVNGPRLRAFDNEDERVLTAIASQMDTAIFESLEKRKLRSAFERSVGPKIMAAILASGKDFLKGERSQVTVLFSDMRGFTVVAERMEAESLVTILNQHFEVMTSIIMKHEGTLDKFVGDEVMALFGAPLPLEDHALRAVRTALEMQRAHKELMARWEATGQEAVPIGIGINSGDMIVGQIGSSKFTDYTVIGDNVNLGSRLCGAAKGHQILISEATYQLVRHAVKANKLASIQVKGRVQPVQTYEVMGLK
jgi:class 3 adenylate cyclase